jgi:hypothetical protein
MLAGALLRLPNLSQLCAVRDQSVINDALVSTARKHLPPWLRPPLDVGA